MWRMMRCNIKRIFTLAFITFATTLVILSLPKENFGREFIYLFLSVPTTLLVSLVRDNPCGLFHSLKGHLWTLDVNFSRSLQQTRCDVATCYDDNRHFSLSIRVDSSLDTHIFWPQHTDIIWRNFTGEWEEAPRSIEALPDKNKDEPRPGGVARIVGQNKLPHQPAPPSMTHENDGNPFGEFFMGCFIMDDLSSSIKKGGRAMNV